MLTCVKLEMAHHDVRGRLDDTIGMFNELGAAMATRIDPNITAQITAEWQDANTLYFVQS